MPSHVDFTIRFAPFQGMELPRQSMELPCVFHGNNKLCGKFMACRVGNRNLNQVQIMLCTPYNTGPSRCVGFVYRNGKYNLLRAFILVYRAVFSKALVGKHH